MKPQSGQTMRSRLSPSGMASTLGPRRAGASDIASTYPPRRRRGKARPPGRLAAQERGDARQLAAFEPFEESAAGGRDVTEIVHHPGMGERRHGVAAAGDAQQLSGL